MRTAKFNYKVNQQIRASELRVIGVDGKQVGVLKLGEALDLARKEEVDLIEIAPGAKPPVGKLIELGKFKYELEKKLQKEKRKSKPSELKEVRFSPFIHAHDFDNRIEKITEFLDEKNKVRAVVVFTGRQLGSKKFGYDILAKVVEKFKDRVVVDMEPKFFGRNLATIISPVSKTKIENGKDEKQTENT